MENFFTFFSRIWRSVIFSEVQSQPPDFSPIRYPSTKETPIQRVRTLIKQQEDPTILDEYIQKNRIKSSTLHNPNRIGETLLDLACQVGHFPIIEYFVEKQKFNIFSTNKSGWNCLTWVAFNDHDVKIMNFLVSKGTSRLVNFETKQCMTPFTYAISNNNFEAVKIMTPHAYYRYKNIHSLMIKYPKMSPAIKKFLGSWPIIKILLFAYLREPESILYHEQCPKDILKLILYWSGLID